MSDTLREFLELLSSLGIMVDKESRNGGRCLQMRMGYVVEYGLITLVPNARDYGNGHLRNTCRQGIGIEIGEVAGGSTTTNDDHYIPLFGHFGNLLQGGNHTLLHPTALHDRRVKAGMEVESVVVVFQLIAEVTITGSSSATDHSDAPKYRRQRQRLIIVQDAIGFQLTKNLLTPQSHVAQRIGRVDIHNVQAIAILRMEYDFHLQHDGKSGTEGLARHGFELTQKRTIGSSPTGDTRLCQECPVVTFVALHQFTVEVATVCRSSLAQFSLHPITVGQSDRQCFADERVEFV